MYLLLICYNLVNFRNKFLNIIGFKIHLRIHKQVLMRLLMLEEYKFINCRF
jgi:hypothetical protein